MKKRQLSTALFAIIASAMQAQVLQQSPRLVVNIVIDQLSEELIEQFGPHFGTSGFKELMKNGIVYPNACYPFSSADRASALATFMTGTPPYYNGIIGNRWLDKQTLRPTGCVADPNYQGIYTTECVSPKNIRTSTITDELKVYSQGKGIVYAIAKDQDAAIISAGHAADGAIWKDKYHGGWCTSSYYTKKAPDWLTQFNNTSASKKKKTEFEQITELTNLAVLCIEQTGMGHDEVSDMLNITLDAAIPASRKNRKTESWKDEAAQLYINLDRQIADLIATIQSKVGRSNVLFFVTGTGYADIPMDEYSLYRVPSGTFHIDRTANLLNLYLGALYGSDKYVRGCSKNHIYLNVEQIEKKKLKTSEILNLSQSFLLQCEGVTNVHTSESLLSASSSTTEPLRNGYNSIVGGQIIVEVAPGWHLQNNETNELYQIHARPTSFPLIIYGAGTKPAVINSPVSIDRVAPTIAKTIHIRAPNACTSLPLF